MKCKKVLVPAAIFILMTFLMGFTPAGPAAKEKYEEGFDKTVSLARDGKVSVKNVSGDVEVKTWDRAEVKIEALKTSRADTIDKAKENAAKVKIVVLEEGKLLRVEADYPETSIKGLNVSIDFDLFIPAQAAVKIKSVSGDAILENIGGSVEVDVVSGDIEVMKASQGLDCQSVSGGLDLQSITGDAYLKTVSGDITLEQLNGSLEAETVSGDIEMTGVSGAKFIKAKILSGSITYQGSLEVASKYELKSHSGDIEMFLPSNSAFDIEAKTFSGDIETDFEISVTGKFSKNKITGTVNGGGAVVSLSTFSGDVTLEKR
jgi:DUF4097 and DUF4098 domain-containing protein YvlB